MADEGQGEEWEGFLNLDEELPPAPAIAAQPAPGGVDGAPALPVLPEVEVPDMIDELLNPVGPAAADGADPAPVLAPQQQPGVAVQQLVQQLLEGVQEDEQALKGAQDEQVLKGMEEDLVELIAENPKRARLEDTFAPPPGGITTGGGGSGTATLVPALPPGHMLSRPVAPLPSQIVAGLGTAVIVPGVMPGIGPGGVPPALDLKGVASPGFGFKQPLQICRACKNRTAIPSKASKSTTRYNPLVQHTCLCDRCQSFDSLRIAHCGYCRAYAARNQQLPH